MSDEQEFEQHRADFLEAARELGLHLSDADVEKGLRSLQARARERGVSMDDIVRENLRELFRESSDLAEEEEDNEEEFDPSDFELTPGEVAALEQASEEIRRKPPVPVPYVLVYKLVNRYTRLRRLRSIGAPASFEGNERALIERALSDLATFAINGEFIDVPGTSQ